MENNNASASDVEPKQGSEAPSAKPEPVDNGKTAINKDGVGKGISLACILWLTMTLTCIPSL